MDELPVKAARAFSWNYLSTIRRHYSNKFAGEINFLGSPGVLMNCKIIREKQRYYYFLNVHHYNRCTSRQPSGSSFALQRQRCQIVKNNTPDQ